MGRRGVTLVEALVATAVLLVLAAILGVVFFRTRDGGKVVGCMSNLHQFAVAFEAYKADNDSHMPYRWLGNAEGVKEWKSAMTPYVGSQDLFYCPSDQFARRTERHRIIDFTYGPVTSYVMSNTVEVHDFSDGRVWTDVLPGSHDPSELKLMTDYTAPVYRRCLEDAQGPYHPNYSPHGEWMNVLYWDYHSKRDKNGQFSAYIRLDAPHCP